MEIILFLLTSIIIYYLANITTNSNLPKQPRFDSYIERKLYYALVNRGFVVETQVRCGPYRIDLTIPEYKIAIECDGKDYHSSPKQKAYDKRRTSYLYRHGYKSVLRFTGKQINRNPYACVDRIERKLRELL